MKREDFFNQNKKFYFNDIDLTANYVKEHCKEELAHVIRVADEVCRKEFKFDLRWDMEQTVVPVVFENRIDWLYMPGDDPEFIFALNRMRYWICLGQAYAVTKDEKYAKAFAQQLTAWIEDVPRKKETERAWRTLEAGLRMEYWTKAMMYFKDSPNITEEVLDKFVGSITDHAEFIMSVWNSYNLMSNWGVLANHGLFIAGVMLPSSPRTREYVDTAIYRLTQELAIQIYPDGSQWEQSPMYHNEVAANYLAVVILAERNGIKLTEEFREKVHAMAMADVIWQKPDGNEFSNGDSDEIDVRDITTTAAAFFKDPVLKSGAYPELDFDSAWELGAEVAEEYKALETKYPSSLTLSLNDSGNFYMRNEYSANASCLHFHCGTLGAGHGHSDQLHVDLFANGEDILIDSGRYTYVNKPERFEFKDSTAHNTTIVDNKSAYTYVDSWECGKTDKAVNTKCKDFADYAYARGGHLGFMTNAQGGVFANRHVIYIKPDIWILADEFYTNGQHSYQNFLHFNNTGVLTNEKENLWKFESEKNKTDFILLGKDLASAVTNTRISRHYNAIEDNKTLKTEWNAAGFTSMFTVISVNGKNNYEPVTAELVPVKSNFKNIIFKDSQIQALKITKGSRSWILAVSHEEYATPTDTFCAEGCTGFGAVTVFNTAKGENSIGTMLDI